MEWAWEDSAGTAAVTSGGLPADAGECIGARLLHGSDDFAQTGSKMRVFYTVHVARVEESSCQVFVVVYDA